MENISLGMMLEEVSTAYPGNTSLIYKDRTITYKELNQTVTAFVGVLNNLGINKGDKVALMLPNIPEFVMSYFAVVRLGAVAVTLNILSTPYELKYLLSNSDSKVFITTSSQEKKFEAIAKDLPLCRHIVLTDGPDSKDLFQGAIRKEPFEREVPTIDGDDPAVMIYTSGLTGNPLGAVLTHKNLSTQSTLLRDMCAGTEHDRGLSLIPFFHSFGAVANMLGVIKLGASTVLMDQFNIDTIFQTIEKEKVTYIAAVPRLFLGMLLHKSADTYDCSSLRLCITGGSTMPPEYIPMFEQRFGVKLMEGYGLTEASPVCSFSRLDMEQKPGSIGIPIPGAAAKVFDGKGNEQPSGKVGELVIKGANVMKGYYKDEKATGDVIHDGWLHTGDLATIDDDGYIFLTGRKKRMIITSGFNVYSREVEIVLNMHPAVKESKVGAKPDLMRGEIVKALIVTKEELSVDEKEIMKHCRTYLSSFKVPREVEFVESLDADGEATS
ncbi:MAG: AMP-binding protein [Deltaproteobacteria bacterium]|nr:AMP-binding protein [Deltaproteobacteria bacterium]